MTTVPQVLTALTTAFTGSVFIGEPTQQQPGDFVAVGWAGPDVGAVVMRQSIAGARLQKEEYTVISQIVTWEGESLLMDCITRAYANLDTLANHLIGDKTLGGVCTQALLSASELLLNQTGSGARAILSVHVDVEAFRR